MYVFPFSVVGYNGLLVSNGFIKNYLDQNILAAQGGALMGIVDIFVQKVMGEVHIPEDSSLRQFLEVENLPKRKLEVRNMTIELMVENYATKEMQRYDIVISPLELVENAFILLILDKDSNRTIKLNLDQEKREIEEILNKSK
jgi:hypothetical protein